MYHILIFILIFTSSECAIINTDTLKPLKENEIILTFEDQELFPINPSEIINITKRNTRHSITYHALLPSGQTLSCKRVRSKNNILKIFCYRWATNSEGFSQGFPENKEIYYTLQGLYNYQFLKN